MTASSDEIRRLALEFGSDIRAADEKVRALSEWTARSATGNEAYIPASLLHHFYTAIESALSRVASILEGGLPGGADSHARLLRLAAMEVPGLRPAILRPDDVDALREVLEFRHFYRHAYGVPLHPERLRGLARLAAESWSGVRERLETFQRFIEGCASE